VRFLPSTLMIVAVAPVSGRLSDRYGPRWLIVGGLILVAASLFSFSQLAVDSNYLDLLPGFMLLGIGIAMTMSPMTSAAMNAVPVQKAGIASGVLSMFRMVGGSLGIAVTGAIFQSVSSSQLEGAGAQPGAAAIAEAFVYALDRAMVVSAFVVLIGVAVAAFAIRPKSRTTISPQAATAEANPGGEALAAEEAQEAVRAA
jgi:MFS family permease